MSAYITDEWIYVSSMLRRRIAMGLLLYVVDINIDPSDILIMMSFVVQHIGFADIVLWLVDVMELVAKHNRHNYFRLDRFAHLSGLCSYTIFTSHAYLQVGFLLMSRHAGVASNALVATQTTSFVLFKIFSRPMMDIGLILHLWSSVARHLFTWLDSLWINVCELLSPAVCRRMFKSHLDVTLDDILIILYYFANSICRCPSSIDLLSRDHLAKPLIAYYIITTSIELFQELVLLIDYPRSHLYACTFCYTFRIGK